MPRKHSPEATIIPPKLARSWAIRGTSRGLTERNASAVVCMNSRSSGTNTSVAPTRAIVVPAVEEGHRLSDMQELAPEAQPPAVVVVQARRRDRCRRGQAAVEHQEQELEQHHRDKGMERVEVAEAQEEEEGAKAGEGRELHGELCPV